MTTASVAEEGDGSRYQYELLHTDALRAIDSQERSLDSLRSSAGTILAASSISSAFLGGLALRDRAWTWCGIGAVISLVLMLLLLIAVLWPYNGWKFHRSTRKLLGDYVEAEVPANDIELLRSLAWYLEDNRRSNATLLEVLYWCFRVACILLIVSVVLWLGDISQGGNRGQRPISTVTTQGTATPTTP
jgi:hypothetical protein